MTVPAYAELQVTTNFTFLEGASHGEEIVWQAAALGLAAVAVTDRNSLAGVVRAHQAARQAGIRLVVGARLDLVDGQGVLAWPTDRAAYGRLCRLLTMGRRRAGKGECHIGPEDVRGLGEGMVFAVIAGEDIGPGFARRVAGWARAFPGAVYLAASHGLRGDDDRRLARLAAIAADSGAPLLATNDVLMHTAARRPLADVLRCIRDGCTIDEAGARLLANGERRLKSPAEMARLFARHPEAVARSLELVERCGFSLDELRYEYPDEVGEEGVPAQRTLERLAWEGAHRRYGARIPDKVTAQVEHELGIIDQLGYAPYFLTVHDIVAFARGRGILCQGRGSAANSAVCFCLGITAVDPARMDVLFERFISVERGEPPDIDVDFEHERREEVIQYIYRRFGRHRAGLAATVIHYRARRAVREVGKAMGLSADAVAALAGQVWGSSSKPIEDGRVRAAGLDPDDPRLRLVLELTHELIGFPRHLSQHVGGFVVTRGRLDEVVPVENAAMADRTVIQWDKDDLDALGILKVDVLALGMLSCIRKAFALIRAHYGRSLDLASVPAEDPAVYDMLCRGDSLGVFQVESRAQMAFLPRMRPRCFYDLVIQVAIIRPGPIQGDMVHPYIRRRHGREAVSYPSAELEGVLGKTLGVPLFQEQAMKIAIVAAGFTPAEADGLRRAMATFRNVGTVAKFREKMVEGMAAKGYDRAFAERCFQQIEGFGSYGFPESHAASFALLVYVSAWLKCHYPAAFACALLNSQPMGFYAPAQIVRDLRDHGGVVCPVDVNRSGWDHGLELGADPEGVDGGWALRLGMRQVKGLAEEDGAWIVAARGNGYWEPRDIWRRAGVGPAALERLADADAFASMDMARREVLWAIRALGAAPLPLFAAAGEDDRGPEDPVALPAMSIGEQVVADYAALRLSLRAHPLHLLRPHLDGDMTAAGLAKTADGDRARISGLVLVRQRPGTAKGVVFMTLEDETGVANIVVWARTFEAFRPVVMAGRLVRVLGRIQRAEGVIHVVADRLEDLSALLDTLADPEARPRAAGAPTVPRPGHPRDQGRALFPSRDYH